MDSLEYLTNGEVAKLTGVKPCHVARDFSSARKSEYIFCRRKCTSYLKEDILKINAKKNEKKQRYRKRPIKMPHTVSKFYGVLPRRDYLKLRNAWYGMHRRCYTEDRADYHHYREEDISICDEWLKNFDCFAQWALDNGYSRELSIDRIDNNQGYSPENCRWADKITQNNNSSATTIIEHNGEALPISHWAKRKGMNLETLRNRIKNGWSVDEAIETPVRPLHEKS